MDDKFDPHSFNPADEKTWPNGRIGSPIFNAAQLQVMMDDKLLCGKVVVNACQGIGRSMALVIGPMDSERAIQLAFEKLLPQIVEHTMNSFVTFHDDLMELEGKSTLAEIERLDGEKVEEHPAFAGTESLTQQLLNKARKNGQKG